MKKILPLIFTALCLLMCVIPSIGMIFAPESQPIGNERKAEPPSITDSEGSLNLSFFTELGDYFGKSFALRSEAITADAYIQAGIFKTSNVGTVTVGDDGWLYYSSTLDDYLGRNTLTEREVNDIIRNLSIIQSFCSANGAQFLFTVPPNKNTLYPEHMPYYTSAEVSGTHNRDLLRAALSDSDISYADLFDLLEDQDEVLYFARDSHWNNKGALLAYDSILKKLGKAHDDYSSVDVTRRKDFTGDLSKMIYPSGSEPEFNYYYGAEERYTYVTDTQSVEDGNIKTSCPDATGKLYMYRDSFGNALLPFFASAYSEAAFTKSFPMLLEKDLEEQRPDVFIMELVERNIRWLIERPPVISSPKVLFYSILDSETTAEITAQAGPCMYSSDYVQFTAEIDSSLIDDNSALYLEVTDSSGSSAIYECYGLSAETGKTGCLAYAKAEDYADKGELRISLLAETESGVMRLGSADITIDQLRR